MTEPLTPQVVQRGLVLCAVEGVTPETHWKTPVYAYSDGGTKLTVIPATGRIRVGEVHRAVSDGMAQVALNWSATRRPADGWGS